ncbi:MAG: phosphatase PAP2 family protein [Melioribacteraceae bacterium]|nr:phosphatase PAP2 family protein [Melioribacteraceae bacterium]
MPNSTIKQTSISMIIFLFFFQNIIAQNNLNFRQFINETGNFIKQPANWEAKDWGLLGLTAASSLLIMQFEDHVRDEILIKRENYNSIPVEFGRIWGEPYNTALISGVNALSGIANNNYLNKKVAFEIIQSALYTGLVTQFLKIAFGKSRPYTGEGSSNFSPINFSGDDNWSFISGHTSLGFSLSTVLSENSKNEFMKFLYYVPAILTAYSRVYQDKHWVSDVFLGALLGYAIGKWTVKIHDINEKQLLPNQQFSFVIPF